MVWFNLRVGSYNIKYSGLNPWEIWISESQERMTLSVPKNKWSDFSALMKRRKVEATVIGEFTDTGKCIVDNCDFKFKLHILKDVVHYLDLSTVPANIEILEVDVIDETCIDLDREIY